MKSSTLRVQCEIGSMNDNLSQSEIAILRRISDRSKKKTYLGYALYIFAFGAFLFVCASILSRYKSGYNTATQTAWLSVLTIVGFSQVMQLRREAEALRMRIQEIEGLNGPHAITIPAATNKKVCMFPVRFAVLRLTMLLILLAGALAFVKDFTTRWGLLCVGAMLCVGEATRMLLFPKIIGIIRKLESALVQKSSKLV